MLGESAALGTLLDGVGSRLRALDPPDAAKRQLKTQCQTQFGELLRSRWNVIESMRASISPPFYWVLVLWLVILFASLGLTAPRNPVSVIVIGLSAVSITVAVFVILDLDIPLGGVFSLPSDPARRALADIDAALR